MDAATKRAVLSAAQRQAEGRPVSLSDRSFWRQHGMPDISIRRDIMARANAVNEGSSAAILGEWHGTLGSLFSGSGYPTDQGEGGPVDTETGRIFARFSFENAAGDTVYRSWAGSFDWDTDLQDVIDSIGAAIDDMEGHYGLSHGSLVAESLLIF
jgi:hypothetical protein